jgi:uncharacterized protein (TIGR03382 family)
MTQQQAILGAFLFMLSRDPIVRLRHPDRQTCRGGSSQSFCSTHLALIAAVTLAAASWLFRRRRE